MNGEEVRVKNTSPLTQEDTDLIFKGIRPEGMDFITFKYYQRLTNAYYKLKLKGTFKHVSSWMEPIEGTKGFVKKTDTYIKGTRGNE